MVQLIKLLFVVHLCILHYAQQSSTCRISEFSCKGGKLCLPLDRFCDGKDDCGDKSDEPKHCTGKNFFKCLVQNLGHRLNLKLNFNFINTKYIQRNIV